MENRQMPPSGGPASSAGDYRHINRLLLVIIVFAVIAIIARQLVVPEMAAGQYGAFRAAAPQEAQVVHAPRMQGESRCNECHEDVVQLHDKDMHTTVACEACHGLGDKHIADPSENDLKMDTAKEACLVCHRALDARPGAFPQVRVPEHFAFVGVADQSIDCTNCHDPHEPFYLDKDLNSARLHPLIQRCQDCHIGRTDTTLKRPADHPAIFECEYCHADTVKDFKTRSHAKLECTTCHAFVKENDFSGRIIRDTDPRFCLLCHRDAKFRSADAPTGIDWPAHLDDVAYEPGDRDKRCIDCHRDRVHELLKR